MKAALDTLRQHLGIARSLLIYYGVPLRQRRLRRFYSEFISPGDLCFDIGAHLGNRTHAWLALGARVVAVEPQPACLRLLRRWYNGRDDVMLLDQAVAASSGNATLRVSRRTPTVTTLSADWSEQLPRAVDSFADVIWDDRVNVATTTLDALLERFGEPVFCKIDIEGFEAEALRGLSRPLPVLSFEYLPGAQAISLACLDRLSQLGDYEYNWSSGESLRLCSPHWLGTANMRTVLTAMPAQANSGDVYARLRAGGE